MPGKTRGNTVQILQKARSQKGTKVKCTIRTNALLHLEDQLVQDCLRALENNERQKENSQGATSARQPPMPQTIPGKNGRSFRKQDRCKKGAATSSTEYTTCTTEGPNGNPTNLGIRIDTKLTPKLSNNIHKSSQVLQKSSKFIAFTPKPGPALSITDPIVQDLVTALAAASIKK